MTEPIPPFDYSHLSVTERILLVQEIWDSIHDAAQDATLATADREEIVRRWADYQAGESTASPWPEVKQRLLGSA